MNDNAHTALSMLGIPADAHAPFIALQDQLAAWQADHPGQSPLGTDECDRIFQQIGSLAWPYFES